MAYVSEDPVVIQILAVAPTLNDLWSHMMQNSLKSLKLEWPYVAKDKIPVGPWITNCKQITFNVWPHDNDDTMYIYKRDESILSIRLKSLPHTDERLNVSITSTKVEIYSMNVNGREYRTTYEILPIPKAVEWNLE